MKIVLVTGVAGFIGFHVAEALLKRGDKVVGVDNLNDYYPVEYKENNITDLMKYPEFIFVKADITDADGITQVFDEHKITHVAHLAARAGVRPSLKDPLLYEKVNVKGTLNLLECARIHKVKNFVLTSSSSVYGNSKTVPFKEDDGATDKPISPYAATKKASEVLGYTYHHLYGLNVNVIRPFTVYGPRGRPDMAPWLFVKAAVKGNSIKKYGDGTTKRDYTFIGDFVPGFITALDKELGYEIFNLGNSKVISLNEFIAIVEKISGKKLQVEEESLQLGDVNITYADISKAKEMLGYNPTTSFEQGMKIFYDWYVENVVD
jgi:UDP-glucuronate 4-epimerase